MAKFHKQTRINKTTGEEKTFSYTLPVPKVIVEQANLQNTEVAFEVKNGTIIVKKNIDNK